MNSSATASRTQAEGRHPVAMRFAPKSARSRRGVYLAASTVEALRRHSARQAEERLFAGERWAEGGLVFATLKGLPLEHSTVTYAFGKALKVAGLPKIRIHDLRHTAATLLLKHGVHPKVVQELLGHSSITLTLDTYSHVVPSLHVEVAAHMQGIMDGPRPNGSNMAAKLPELASPSGAEGVAREPDSMVCREQR